MQIHDAFLPRKFEVSTPEFLNWLNPSRVTGASTTLLRRQVGCLRRGLSATGASMQIHTAVLPRKYDVLSPEFRKMHWTFVRASRMRFGVVAGGLRGSARREATPERQTPSSPGLCYCVGDCIAAARKHQQHQSYAPSTAGISEASSDRPSGSSAGFPSEFRRCSSSADLPSFACILLRNSLSC